NTWPAGHGSGRHAGPQTCALAIPRSLVPIARPAAVLDTPPGPRTENRSAAFDAWGSFDMLTVRHLNGALANTEVKIEQGKDRVVVGRQLDCDIQYPPEETA